MGAFALATADAAPFRLVEGTADGGGQHSQGSRFALEGSIGQPDAGHLVGQRFAVHGGLWRPAPAATTDLIFRNSFEN